jgi:hypothetical protein
VNLVSADAFLALFFLMYVAVSILSCMRQEPDLKGYVSARLGGCWRGYRKLDDFSRTPSSAGVSHTLRLQQC